MRLQPRIYVACLASYNNGYHHGAWLDVNDELEDSIQAILKSSPIANAEEWAIHDHEGLGNVGEYEGLDTLIPKAAFIAEHSDLGIALLEEFCGDLEDAEQCMENYNGCFKSEVAFAEYIFEECHANAIPDNLLFYFDFELFARDLFINDYRSVNVNGECHVFNQF